MGNLIFIIIFPGCIPVALLNLALSGFNVERAVEEVKRERQATSLLLTVLTSVLFWLWMTGTVTL